MRPWRQRKNLKLHRKRLLIKLCGYLRSTISVRPVHIYFHPMATETAFRLYTQIIIRGRNPSFFGIKLATVSSTRHLGRDFDGCPQQPCFRPSRVSSGETGGEYSYAALPESSQATCDVEEHRTAHAASPDEGLQQVLASHWSLRQHPTRHTAWACSGQHFAYLFLFSVLTLHL